MRPYNRSTLGETYDHTKADERHSNKWVLISMMGMVAIAFLAELIVELLDKTP